MIGHLFSNIASLWINDFHKIKISNDFDSVLKKVITFLERYTFFNTEMFQDLSRICD